MVERVSPRGPSKVRIRTVELNDDVLARLGHLNYVEFGRESCRWSAGSVTREEDGVVLLATGSSFPVLGNGIYRVDDRASAIQVLDAADRWFAELGRGYTVMVRDTDVDRELEREARARGMVELLAMPEMVCRRRLEERPVPNGAALGWVEDVAAIADFAAVSSAAYEALGLPSDVTKELLTASPRFLEPHVHAVVAYLDDSPVAAAMTVLSHGIAGVYWVGTIEAARGSGLGEAVTRAVTNRAFDRGALVNTLQASPMGEPVYRRMGYETLYGYRGLVHLEPPA
jgi:hypothetical protein